MPYPGVCEALDAKGVRITTEPKTGRPLCGVARYIYAILLRNPGSARTLVSPKLKPSKRKRIYKYTYAQIRQLSCINMQEAVPATPQLARTCVWEKPGL